MKRKFFQPFYFIATKPNGFSILEILILLLGIGTGVFIYFRMDQIRTQSLSARSFDRETQEILLSISLAQINFNNLMNGFQDIDLEKDVDSYLDQAETLCTDLDMGGPSGKFVPVLQDNSTAAPSMTVCNQIAQFHALLNTRWQDHLDGKADVEKTPFEYSFSQTLKSLQLF